jgi:hypothetical protein
LHKFFITEKISLTSCLWCCSSNIIFRIISLGDSDIYLPRALTFFFECLFVVSCDSHHLHGLSLSRIIHFAIWLGNVFSMTQQLCFSGVFANLSSDYYFRSSCPSVRHHTSDGFGRSNSLFSSDAKCIRIYYTNIIHHRRATERVWCL